MGKESKQFELIVGEENGQIHNGDIAVRWCVTPELVNELEKHDIKDAHVMLVSATDAGDEMDRKVVPITELMTYVRFTRAGKMKLYGFILNGDVGRKKLYQIYKQRVGGEYKTDVVCYYTEKPFDDIKYEYTRTEVSLEIPEGVFGKEPSPWVKWFVNLWHDSDRVVDECHYRRRFLLAFTLKWIPVTLWYFIQVLGRAAAVAFMFGLGFTKGYRFEAIYRPYKWNSISYHLLDNVSNDNNIFLVKRKNLNNNEDVLLITPTIFYPSIVLVWAGAFYALSLWVDINLLATLSIVFSILLFSTIVFDSALYIGEYAKAHNWSKRFNGLEINLDKTMVTLKIIFSLMLLGAIAYLISLSVTAGIIVGVFAIVAVSIMLFGKEIFTWLENIYTVPPENNDYTEIRELLCPKDDLNLRADIDFIPSKQRTVRLWYLEMKHKVCKPMQR